MEPYQFKDHINVLAKKGVFSKQTALKAPYQTTDGETKERELRRVYTVKKDQDIVCTIAGNNTLFLSGNDELAINFSEDSGFPTGVVIRHAGIDKKRFDAVKYMSFRAFIRLETRDS